MKKIVLFFVNPTQIIKLSNGKLSKEVLPDANDYIVLSVKTKIKKIEKLSSLNLTSLGNEILIVVNDNYDVDRIINTIHEYLKSNQCNIYSVFHKSTANAGTLSESFLEKFGTNYKSYKNEHEIAGSIFDLYLVPLLLDFNSKLFNELISKLPDPVLEAKLELLHNCLVPSGSPKELPKVLLDSPQGKEFEIAYKKFLNSCEGMTDENSFDTAFIDSLRNLRIVLLGS